jgi:hypothetical protein
MRLSVLNDRTSPILPDGSQADRLSGFNDLGEEFTILRKVRTDTIMIAASYPSRLPMWDQKRKAAIGPACLGRDRARIHYPRHGAWGSLPHCGN